VANTRRKTSVSISADRECLLGLGGGRFKYITSIGLDRQETSASSRDFLERVVPLTAKMAATATALHAHWSGSTVSVTDGNMSGLPRFAVSTHPERTMETTKAPTWRLLFAFAVLNLDLLLLPNHALGTWFQHQRRQHILDVVECPASLDEAIRLGLLHGQEAIYDLEAGKEISLVTGHELAATRFGGEGN
jgi:hypothetical protein